MFLYFAAAIVAAGRSIRLQNSYRSHSNSVAFMLLHNIYVQGDGKGRGVKRISTF